MTKRMTQTRKAWLCGFAIAVANLARDHMEQQLAAFVLGDSGVALEEFERAGLDDYDLIEIRKLFSDGYLDKAA